MHILFANRWYPPQSNGGVAIYNYYLAQALVQLGHHVTMIASRTSINEPAYICDHGVHVYRLLTQHYARLHRLPKLGRYVRPLQQMLYSLHVAKQIRRIEVIDPPNVIEFAEVNAEGWAYLRQRQRYPVVVRCHTPTFVLRDYYAAKEMPYDTELTTRLEQFCIQHADALTSPSQDMAKTVARYMAISPERFQVIPNPIDVTQFAVEHRKAQGKKELHVLHVGRLDRTKGVEVLAKAIPVVVRQCPQVNFVYVGSDRPTGDGDTWQERLLAFFAKEGVANHVRFCGSVDQQTLLQWYHQADIAVVPSLLYESFSYTVAQAMAAGLPIIASRMGGIPETVGGAGYLVEPGSASSLIDALLKLVNEPILRKELSDSARLQVQQFDSNLIASQMLRFYQKVIS